jgi:MoxR-like ATPase
MLLGRDYVLPDDIKALAEPALAHRSLVSSAGQSQGKDSRTFIAEVLKTIPVPGALAE